jgi:hypothetical protein
MTALNVGRIRSDFDLYRSLIPWYENVHRGQSASTWTTWRRWSTGEQG